MRPKTTGWMPAALLVIAALQGEAEGKNQYIVGGLAITGAAKLFQQFNSTFATYLTLAVRQNPKYQNISFQLISLDFYSTFDLVSCHNFLQTHAIQSKHLVVCPFDQVEQGAIDFVYTNPSIYSCLESEFQLTSLATLRNLALNIEVDQFGGVIFSKAGDGRYLVSSKRKGKQNGLLYRQRHQNPWRHRRPPCGALFPRSIGRWYLTIAVSPTVAAFE